MGAAGLISGRWHALVISHRRSSTLLFNKDQLEVSTFFFRCRSIILLVDRACSILLFFHLKEAYCLMGGPL